MNEIVDHCLTHSYLYVVLTGACGVELHPL